jgi:hypothetical protein
MGISVTRSTFAVFRNVSTSAWRPAQMFGQTAAFAGACGSETESSVRSSVSIGHTVASKTAIGTVI